MKSLKERTGLSGGMARPCPENSKCPSTIKSGKRSPGEVTPAGKQALRQRAVGSVSGKSGRGVRRPSPAPAAEGPARRARDALLPGTGLRPRERRLLIGPSTAPPWYSLFFWKKMTSIHLIYWHDNGHLDPSQEEQASLTAVCLLLLDSCRDPAYIREQRN